MKITLTARLLTTAAAATLAGGAALAQPMPASSSSQPPKAAAAPVYDPQQLPALHGIVAHYTLTPRPPPEAARFESFLKMGATIAVQGDGRTTPLGSVVAVRAIGSTPDQLNQVQAPPPPPYHGRRHGRPSRAGQLLIRSVLSSL